MKTYQIVGGTDIKVLPLLSAYRKGDVPAEFYIKQATGETPRVVPDLRPGRFVRTILLEDGSFSGLASDSGSLLTFVISGTLTLTAGSGQTVKLSPGDLFLVDKIGASHISVHASDTCRLVQVGVNPDWPGPEATAQNPGTLTPRVDGEIKIKRVIKGDDDLAYYREFPELFSGSPNEWSVSRPVAGLRFMCWEDGFIDWHPEVVNNLAIFLSGELELEASGDRVANVFHAGDICLAQDRTGVGHVDRCRGATHVALIVMDTEQLW